MAAMYQFIKYFIYLTRKKLACAKLICGFVSFSNTAITFSSAQCPYISIVSADLERRYILRRTLMNTTMNCSFRLLHNFPPASGSKNIFRYRREQIGTSVSLFKVINPLQSSFGALLPGGQICSFSHGTGSEFGH